MSTTTTTYKSRTIKGHKVTLKVGERYVASRPMGDRLFPVTIRKPSRFGNWKEVLTIHGLSYEAANEFLNAFNNGKTSFEGRIWK